MVISDVAWNDRSTLFTVGRRRTTWRRRLLDGAGRRLPVAPSATPTACRRRRSAIDRSPRRGAWVSTNDDACGCRCASGWACSGAARAPSGRARPTSSERGTGSSTGIARRYPQVAVSVPVDGWPARAPLRRTRHSVTAASPIARRPRVPAPLRGLRRRGCGAVRRPVGAIRTAALESHDGAGGVAAAALRRAPCAPHCSPTRSAADASWPGRWPSCWPRRSGRAPRACRALPVVLVPVPSPRARRGAAAATT